MMFKRALAVSGILILTSFAPAMAAVDLVGTVESCGANCATEIQNQVAAEINAIKADASLSPAQKDAALIALIQQVANVSVSAPPAVRAVLSAAVKSIGGALSKSASAQVQKIVTNVANAVAAGAAQTATASTDIQRVSGSAT